MADKELFWLVGTVVTPPLSENARIEMGYLLRRVQQGESIGLPASRPMPTMGKRCHELRVNDERVTWRLVYRIDSDAIVIIKWFSKKTEETPKHVINLCKKRIKAFDDVCINAGLTK